MSAHASAEEHVGIDGKWANPLHEMDDDPTGSSTGVDGAELFDAENPTSTSVETPKAQPNNPSKKNSHRKLQGKTKEKGIAPESAFSVGLCPTLSASGFSGILASVGRTSRVIACHGWMMRRRRWRPF